MGPFAVVQWNCNGLRNKIVEITGVMFSSEKIYVLPLYSESCLILDAHWLPLVIILRDRTYRGGGLAFTLHKNVAFRDDTVFPYSLHSNIETNV